MTTDQLHRCLRRDVEVLSAANAGLWIAAAAPLLLAPALTASLIGAEPSGLAPARPASLALALLGLALAVAGRRPLAARTIAGIAVLDGLLALTLLAAPFALGLQLGLLAWLVTGAIALIFFTGTTAWFFVRDRLAGTGPHPTGQPPVPDEPAGPEPPAAPLKSSS